jgi:hypothetical protein
MTPLQIKNVTQYVEENIGTFHQKRIDSLDKLKLKNDLFLESYAKTINKFTKEFANDFCLDTGEIDWEKLVEFNSGMKK